MAQFTTDIFAQFDKKWALLSAGTKEKHNTMTGKSWRFILCFIDHCKRQTL
jgi:hypothetical protein